MDKIGFDIGSSSMKIAVIKGDGLRLEEIRLPENMVEGDTISMPNAFSQYLKKIKKELDLPRAATAGLILPYSQVICRQVTMPKMTQGQLMMNLPYEFSDFIQGLPGQYFCDYALCEHTPGEDPESMPMMAAVAAKHQLEEYAGIFSAAGIRLRTILPQEMALTAIAKANAEGRPEEFCFVDLGHQRTRITVIWRDRVQATRQIALGGRQIDQIAAEELGIDAFLANGYKTAGSRDVLGIPAVTDICERIAVEILKVINFYRFTYQNSDLGEIYLVGGGAALEPLRQAIAGQVGLELRSPAELLPAGVENAASGIFAAGVAMEV